MPSLSCLKKIEPLLLAGNPFWRTAWDALLASLFRPYHRGLITKSDLVYAYGLLMEKTYAYFFVGSPLYGYQHILPDSPAKEELRSLLVLAPKLPAPENYLDFSPEERQEYITQSVQKSFEFYERAIQPLLNQPQFQPDSSE